MFDEVVVWIKQTVGFIYFLVEKNDFKLVYYDMVVENYGVNIQIRIWLRSYRRKLGSYLIIFGNFIDRYSRG